MLWVAWFAGHGEEDFGLGFEWLEMGDDDIGGGAKGTWVGAGGQRWACYGLRFFLFPDFGDFKILMILLN